MRVARCFDSLGYFSAKNNKRNPPFIDGLIGHVTDLRVVIIISGYSPVSRDAIHERKTYFNKKRLGEDVNFYPTRYPKNLSITWNTRTATPNVVRLIGYFDLM